MSYLFRILFIFFFPAIAFANGDTPVGNGIAYFIDAMTGTTGIAFATVAIIGVGIGCLTNYVKWSTLFIVVAGIAIIFGSGIIVNGIVSYVK